jgi:integrase/recombinase XerD
MASSKSVAFDVGRYSHVQSCEHANTWFRIQSNLGLAPNTLNAYGRSLNDFIGFTEQSAADVVIASREHVSAWVRDLLSRRNKRCEFPASVRDSV